MFSVGWNTDKSLQEKNLFIAEAEAEADSSDPRTATFSSALLKAKLTLFPGILLSSSGVAEGDGMI